VAFNGSGTYVLPAGNPVVTGTTISSTWANNTLNDMATALTDCVTRDGQSPATANLPMGGFKITGLAASTANGDAVRYEQVPFLAGTALPVASGGTGVTTSTGSGNVVLSTSPTLVTPVLGTPTSGTLSSCTVDGTDAVGFRNIPVNSQSAAYTAVLADSGKCILHPSTDANARTFTIPANASVAYPIGTAITFINMTAAVVSIAITTDTMYLSSAGTTGTRSLAQYGSATAIKMTSTTWLISGSGLT
jgi:hypothetical protein